MQRFQPTIVAKPNGFKVKMVPSPTGEYIKLGDLNKILKETIATVRRQLQTISDEIPYISSELDTFNDEINKQ